MLAHNCDLCHYLQVIPESRAAAASLIPCPGLRDAGTALQEAGYNSIGLRQLLATRGTDIPYTATDLVTYERRLATAIGPLSAIAALFCLGWSRPADELVAAAGRSSVDSLIASGCLIEDNLHLRATVRILPHGELLVASDRRPEPAGAADPLHVTGINGPATLLASLTVRTQGGRALDLGTGNGIQALLAASHADFVVATDINPRALAFGRFNAALNGIERIEFRLGSWFDPVVGERFDLVVGNPPYVISPEADLVYRDSGDEPGALCGRLVRDVTDHLTDGGFSTLLASWPLSDYPWWTVPATWPGPDGLAWLLMMRSEDPLTHAAQWNLPLATGRTVDELGLYREAIGRWQRYLTDRGIEAIGYGAVIQQRRPGAGRVIRTDEVHSGAGSAGGHIRRVFNAADILGTEPEAIVADRTCKIPAEARIDATLVPAGLGWTQSAAYLRLNEGIGIRAELDTTMTEIVLAATNGATVDDAADAAAERLDLTANDASGLHTAGRSMVAELIALGLLELADT